MATKWDEKLENLSERFGELSKKAAEASAEAREKSVLSDENIQDKLSTARGNVEALKENIRLAGEENKSKLSSALLKAQMTIEAKLQDRMEAKDKKRLEDFIEDHINYTYDCFEAAAYLLADGQLAILEAIDAAAEYDEKYGQDEES
ncbi:MAG: hypothetical protein K6G42_00265 [Lachnospiraceae bacterium]|nr:hypothetical protein [Lachnospiraceae bacterium]